MYLWLEIQKVDFKKHFSEVHFTFQCKTSITFHWAWSLSVGPVALLFSLSDASGGRFQPDAASSKLPLGAIEYGCFSYLHTVSDTSKVYCKSLSSIIFNYYLITSSFSKLWFNFFFHTAGWISLLCSLMSPWNHSLQVATWGKYNVQLQNRKLEDFIDNENYKSHCLFLIKRTKLINVVWAWSMHSLNKNRKRFKMISDFFFFNDRMKVAVWSEFCLCLVKNTTRLFHQSIASGTVIAFVQQYIFDRTTTWSFYFKVKWNWISMWERFVI